jgi:hypothetical protein
MNAVLKQLQEFSYGKREWYLSKVLKTAMFGSGEIKENCLGFPCELDVKLLFVCFNINKLAWL